MRGRGGSDGEKQRLREQSAEKEQEASGVTGCSEGGDRVGGAPGRGVL